MIMILTHEQIKAGRAWYTKHTKHVAKLIKNEEIEAAPTLKADKQDPALWKPMHWKWFLKRVLKLEL